jgi:hypothetical protein
MITQPKFSINKVEYTFHPITLRRYLELQNYVGEETTENKFAIVSAITQCPVEELRKLTYKDWLIVWEEILFYISFSTSADTIQPVIEFEGVEYSLPEIDDISIGEYIDLDLILHSEKSDRKLNEIAAILYRPIVSKKGGVIRIEPYDTKDTKARAERFMDLPISAIKSANAFFLLSAKSLQKNLLESLNLPKMIQSLHPEDREQLQNYLQQELGGLQLTEFQETIHSILERQHDSQSDPFLISWLGKKLRPRKKNLNSKKQDR